MRADGGNIKIETARGASRTRRPPPPPRARLDRERHGENENARAETGPRDSELRDDITVIFQADYARAARRGGTLTRHYRGRDSLSRPRPDYVLCYVV